MSTAETPTHGFSLFSCPLAPTVSALAPGAPPFAFAHQRVDIVILTHGKVNCKTSDFAFSKALHGQLLVRWFPSSVSVKEPDSSGFF